VFLSMNRLEGSEQILSILATDLRDQKRNERIVSAGKLAATILENVGEAVIVCDPEGTITHASRIAADFCGEFPLGRAFDEVFHLEIQAGPSGETSTPRFTDMLEGFFKHVETRYVREDGRILDLLLTSTPLLDEEGERIGLVLTMVDITERKQAEKKLSQTSLELGRESARTRAIIDNMVEGLVVADADGNIIEMNPAGLSIHGFVSLDEIRRHLNEYPEIFEDRAEDGTFIPVEEWPMAKALRGEVFTGYELWVTRKDTGKKWVGRYSGAPVRDGDGNIIMGVITLEDITERKLVEKALRNSEARYRELVQNANSAIIRWKADGTLTFFNEFAQSFFGYSEEEAVGRHVSFMVPEKESTGIDLTGLVQDVVANPERYVNFVNENVRKDGSRVWMAWTNKPIFNAEGKVTEILSIGSDITDRKRVEEALRQSMDELKLREREARERGRFLDAMMEYIPMGITIADAPDVTIRRVSRYGKELIGRSSEQIEGIPVDKHVEHWDIYHADGVTRASNEELPLTRATQKGEQVREELWVLGHPDGKKIPILCNAAPIRDEHCDIVGGVLGWQDITELLKQREKLQNLANQLEDRIRERTLELEQANRAKDEFMANMSHEIRTPMSGVLGLTEILLHQDLPEKVRDDVEMVRSSAESALTLINDLFDISRISQVRFEFHPEEFDLRAMIRDATGPFQFQALSKDLDFIVSIDESVPSQILCDKDRLGQVIKNLVSNAIKFTVQGFVRIEVKAEEQDADMLRLLVSVSDSGMGIPRSKQKDIFSAFTQLDSSYSKNFAGMGLGLAISKSLVEGMGGEIKVDSVKGKGATFSFYVTCGIVTREQVLTAPSTTLNDLPPMTILLAEDNAVNRLFLRRALVTAGHKVGEAEDGKDALSKLSEAPFDLVLMDIQMPEMDGVEATRQIRSGKHGRADIPIIALTAYAMKGDREKFLDNGMDGYVTKPVDFGELARVIADVCGLETS
jgi:PAS domain S-box-containing protein